MSRFTDLFSNTDVPQEPVVHPKVEEPVVVEEPKVEEPVAEVLPPKPLQNIARPSLRRTHR